MGQHNLTSMSLTGDLKCRIKKIAQEVKRERGIESYPQYMVVLEAMDLLEAQRTKYPKGKSRKS